MYFFEAERNETFLKLILFSSLVFFLFFVCIELGARVFLAAQNHSLAYLLYGFKDIRKFREIKNKDGLTLYYKGVPSKDKKNPVNRLGFRGGEIEIIKTSAYRIICLGSSTTYGDDLNYDDTYPAILQKKLNEVFGESYCEVINAGMSGFDLKNIYSMVKNEIIYLMPDIITICNINNNFHAPGFWFVDVKGQTMNKAKQEKNSTIIKSLEKIKMVLEKKSAFFFLLNKIMLQDFLRYVTKFDWNGFANALIRDDNIWEHPFQQNLLDLIHLMQESCPTTKIILLTEAVNTINFPALEKPFKRAYKILDDINKQYHNVYVLDIYTPILNAARQNPQIWSDPEGKSDPLHLSRQGNEIIAEKLSSFLIPIIKNTPSSAHPTGTL